MMCVIIKDRQSERQMQILARLEGFLNAKRASAAKIRRPDGRSIERAAIIQFFPSNEKSGKLQKNNKKLTAHFSRKTAFFRRMGGASVPAKAA